MWHGGATRALDLLVGAHYADDDPLRWFIRDRNLYILPKSKPSRGEAVQYSSALGTLIGSPSATKEGGVRFRGVLVDATLRVGKVVYLESRRFNGHYKVVSLNVQGDNYGNTFHADIQAMPYT